MEKDMTKNTKSPRPPAPSVKRMRAAVEKAMAGATGDTSGVSQDLLASLLSYMQDRAASGIIAVGPPGSGKSAWAKATGNTGKIPTIVFDLGGMKGSLVGQSEANIRSALKLVSAVADDNATPFQHIQPAIDWAGDPTAPPTRPRRVCVAAGATCSGSSFATYAENLRMADAVDVYGSYESTAWTRCPARACSTGSPSAAASAPIWTSAISCTSSTSTPFSSR